MNLNADQKDGARILVGLGLFPFAWAWQSLVLLFLWRWFIVAATGLSPISFSTAAGLDLLVAYLISPAKKPNEEIPSIPSMLWKQLGWPLFVLVLGLVAHAIGGWLHG